MSTATPERIMKLAMGFWASKTLFSAVELGVFSALADGPADLATLQKKLGLHQRSARDFLDALVALKMLERDNGMYRNAFDADLFLDRAKPSYVGSVLELANARSNGIWCSLTEALRTGKSQNETKQGKDFFEAIYSEPEWLRPYVESLLHIGRGFLGAMSALSAGPAQGLAAKFPWRDYATFVDVGSAQGTVPVTLARTHSNLKGIGFDLPAVRPVFEAFVAGNGLSDRVRFQSGNFFEDALPKADVIIMGHILHNWDLTQRKMLLTKAFEALPNGGAIIIYDAIIDDERRENASGLLMSLNMLIETPSGFEYTGADCQGWLRESGFSKTRIQHLDGPDSMVIGLK